MVERSAILSPLALAWISGYSEAVNCPEAFSSLPEVRVIDLLCTDLIQGGLDKLELITSPDKDKPTPTFLSDRIEYGSEK